MYDNACMIGGVSTICVCIHQVITEESVVTLRDMTTYGVENRGPSTQIMHRIYENKMVIQ